MGDFRPRGARYTLSPRDFSLNTRNHRQLLPARDTGTRGPVVELLTTPARAGEVLHLAKLGLTDEHFQFLLSSRTYLSKGFIVPGRRHLRGTEYRGPIQGWSHFSTSTLWVYPKFSAHPVRLRGDSGVPRYGWLAPTALQSPG